MTMPKQEKRFDYKGFPCVILFMPVGYRCGYVGVSNDMEIDTDSIDCHYGITYKSDRLHHQKDTDRFWIGFDCGHCCDGYNVDKIKEYFSDDESVMRQTEIMKDYFETVNEDSPARTLEYCEEQCRHIVDQILQTGGSHDTD